MKNSKSLPHPYSSSQTSLSSKAVPEVLRSDLEAARIIQSRLFPRCLAHISGLDYSGESRPASQVGGDFYDFAVPQENVLSVSIGDVSGPGIAASILMSGLRAFLHGLLTSGSQELPSLVEQLNRAFYQTSPDYCYATLFYAHIDCARHRMRYVNAGHEPALLFRMGTGVIQELAGTGTVLGLTPRSVYQSRVVSFHPGDLLVVFTDGITEAGDAAGHELGQRGVVRAIQSDTSANAADLVRAILEEASRFTGYVDAVDDRTTVVVRFLDPSHQLETDEESIQSAACAA